MDSDLEARRARAGRCTQIAAGLAGAHLLLWLLLAPALREPGVTLMLAPALAQAAGAWSQGSPACGCGGPIARRWCGARRSRRCSWGWWWRSLRR
ncbi:hypothetical protein [Nannocystis pusilla]|uniref:hypothetical protein n=1 Tax=Nannocystis pusilla TaxID=889268 RepID=UPI003B7C191D